MDSDFIEYLDLSHFNLLNWLFKLSSFGHSASWLFCLFNIPQSLWFFWTSFLLSNTVRGSSWLSPVPAGLRHFYKSHGFLWWKIVLETKIWVLGMLIDTRVSLLLGPLNWHYEKIYVYTNLFIYRYLKICQHVTIYTYINYEFLLKPPSFLIHFICIILASSPFVSVSSHRNNNKPVSHHSSSMA